MGPDEKVAMINLCFSCISRGCHLLLLLLLLLLLWDQEVGVAHLRQRHIGLSVSICIHHCDSSFGMDLSGHFELHDSLFQTFNFDFWLIISGWKKGNKSGFNFLCFRKNLINFLEPINRWLCNLKIYATNHSQSNKYFPHHAPLHNLFIGHAAVHLIEVATFEPR